MSESIPAIKYRQDRDRYFYFKPGTRKVAFSHPFKSEVERHLEAFLAKRKVANKLADQFDAEKVAHVLELERKMSPTGFGLATAVDFYLDRGPRKGGVTLRELTEKCIAHKKLIGLDESTVSQAERYQTQLATWEHYDTPADLITPDQWSGWLIRPEWNSTTQGNKRRVISRFYNWGMDTEINNPPLVRLNTVSNAPIQVGDPDKAIAYAPVDAVKESFIATWQNDRDFLAAMTALFFCGLRPFEVGIHFKSLNKCPDCKHIRTDDERGRGFPKNECPSCKFDFRDMYLGTVDTSNGNLSILGAKRRSRRRRGFKVHPTALAWFELCDNLPTPEMPAVFAPKVNTRKRWEALRPKVNSQGEGYSADLARHSYATYFHNAYSNEHQLQKRLGHANADLLHSTYVGAASEDQSLAFWNLTPNNIL